MAAERNPDSREVLALLLERGLQIFDYIRSQGLLFGKKLFKAIFSTLQTNFVTTVGILHLAVAFRFNSGVGSENLIVDRTITFKIYENVICSKLQACQMLICTG